MSDELSLEDRILAEIEDHLKTGDRYGAFLVLISYKHSVLSTRRTS